MVLSPQPTDFRETTSNPRREVVPSISMAYFSMTLTVATPLYIYQSVAAGVESTEPAWLLAHRSVFDFSIFNSFVGQNSNAHLLIENWVGAATGYHRHDIVLLPQNVMTTRQLYRIPGWAARFTLVSHDADVLVVGFMRVRGET